MQLKEDISPYYSGSVLTGVPGTRGRALGQLQEDTSPCYSGPVLTGVLNDDYTPNGV